MLAIWYYRFLDHQKDKSYTYTYIEKHDANEMG